ncbi:hypothetical protein [Nitrosospira sp. Nsp13]|jgi:hypothetical protein|nr:hypothetical protein [Nitrosospira sp. Nsp13]SCX86307.1 hypothetical protein SAMN05216308_101615 [Nitrosospira sp. Nsp13]
MNSKLSTPSLLIAGILMAGESLANASAYKFTDLGTLGGSFSSAHH